MKGEKMIWRGESLSFRDQFVAAIGALASKEDAREFKAVFANAFPKSTDILLAVLADDACDPSRSWHLLDVAPPSTLSLQELLDIADIWGQIPHR